jgi:hypothetical protein
MLSEALQRNAKHEATLSNISGFSLMAQLDRRSEIESLASRASSAALQLLSLRMTTGLSSASSAAENSSQDPANELPTDLAAGSAHRALSHCSRNRIANGAARADRRLKRRRHSSQGLFKH